MLIGILSVAGAATLLGIMPTLQKQVRSEERRVGKEC